MFVNFHKRYLTAQPVITSTQLPTADCWLLTANCQLQTADCLVSLTHPQPLRGGEPAADCQLPTAACGMRLAACGLKIANCQLFFLRSSVFRLRSSSSKFPVHNYRAAIKSQCKGIAGCFIKGSHPPVFQFKTPQRIFKS